ncbi:protein lifeguard 1-like [Brevipalpus obovatus]|uniref:protein lifeguard 1-like n=1 Tax=Brevipalpus obovatus TaxID=246614 RepID=UPI003D9EBFDE
MFSPNYNYNTNVEAGYATESMDNAFSDKAIRMGFIRKVYGIICIQLVVTMGFALVFSTSDSTKMFLVKNTWILIVTLILSIICMIGLTCCGLARSYPLNMICLSIFTLCMATTVGMSCAFRSGDVVLMAVVMTTIIVVGLTIFAFQTKIDFTMISGIMFVVILVFCVFGIVAMFWQNKIVHIIYSAGGTLIFSIYLVIDTQLLVGGKRSELSPEDYVLGALMIYMDIINIFLHLLRLIELLKSD